MMPPTEDTEVKKLKEKRYSQLLWIAYAILVIVVVSFPVFIFLYPNELDMIGQRVQNVLMHSVRILIIPFLAIHLNFYLKKRKLKITAANQESGESNQND